MEGLPHKHRCELGRLQNVTPIICLGSQGDLVRPTYHSYEPYKAEAIPILAYLVRNVPDPPSVGQTNFSRSDPVFVWTLELESKMRRWNPAKASDSFLYNHTDQMPIPLTWFLVGRCIDGCPRGNSLTCKS